MGEGLAQDHVNAIAMRAVADAWIDDVHSVAAPSATGINASDARQYHLASAGVVVEDAKRVSVLRSSMENPQNRGSGGNGYLFEVSRTNDVLFADDEARNGRHDFRTGASATSAPCCSAARRAAARCSR